MEITQTDVFHAINEGVLQFYTTVSLKCMPTFLYRQTVIASENPEIIKKLKDDVYKDTMNKLREIPDELNEALK